MYVAARLYFINLHFLQLASPILPSHAHECEHWDLSRSSNAARRKTSLGPSTGSGGTGALEEYTYDAHDLVTAVKIGTIADRVVSSYDVLGRLTGHLEKDASGQTIYERHSLTYSARGQLLSEKGRRKLANGDWHYTHTANYYDATGAGGAQPALGAASDVGTSTGALLSYSETKNWLNGTASPVYGTPGNYHATDTAWADSYSTYTYAWRDPSGAAAHPDARGSTGAVRDEPDRSPFGPADRP